MPKYSIRFTTKTGIPVYWQTGRWMASMADATKYDTEAQANKVAVINHHITHWDVVVNSEPWAKEAAMKGIKP